MFDENFLNRHFGQLFVGTNSLCSSKLFVITYRHLVSFLLLLSILQLQSNFLPPPDGPLCDTVTRVQDPTAFTVPCQSCAPLSEGLAVQVYTFFAMAPQDYETQGEIA